MVSTERGIDAAFAEVERVWRENRCLTEDTIALYRRWAQRFLQYCRRRALQPMAELTHAGVTRFIREYIRRGDLGADHTLENGRAALHRWAEALQTLGEQTWHRNTPCARSFMQSLRVAR